MSLKFAKFIFFLQRKGLEAPLFAGAISKVADRQTVVMAQEKGMGAELPTPTPLFC
jgi:hypothetical protein